MKTLCGFMMVLIVQQAIAGIVRKPPAFSTPVYSSSYLPAAMQVIFHVVDQLKQMESEEISQYSGSEPPSTTQSMKEQQVQSTTSEMIAMIAIGSTTSLPDEKTETLQLSSFSDQMTETLSQGLSVTCDDLTESAQNLQISTAIIPDSVHEEKPEVNEETAETNYATPEINQETSEPVQESQEPNQESPEINEEQSSSTTDVSQVPSTQISISEITDNHKKKKPTIDSIVGEIYEIVKPTTSPLIEESDIDSESKSSSGVSVEKMESIEDEEEETRFTLLGEKVAQVPRPSLSSYLRRAKVPPSPALRQLASLYDALSKDARKQGFARFAGYSNEVLKILESSAEGGVGPQLKKLLEKVVERNELTRDDARMKTSETLRDLDSPASALNKSLRRLLPLRYTA